MYCPAKLQFFPRFSELLSYFYNSMHLMMFIDSIGMAAATPAAIKPQQLSLPLAKLFTLSRTASNHDFLISILLLGR